MNVTVYIFKKETSTAGDRILSFPTALDRYTRMIVDKYFQFDDWSPSLLVVRNDKLVYYLYRLNIADEVFGFIFIVNNVYLVDVAPLSRFCGDMIATMGARHLLVRWSSTGELEFTSPKIKDCREEAEQVLIRLEEIRNVSVFDKAIQLPPLDFSSDSPKGGAIDFRNATDKMLIPEKSRQQVGLGILLPKVKYPVAGVLHASHADIQSGKKQYDELTRKYARLSNQKKRMKWVIFLCLCIVAGGFVLLSVNKNLKHTQSDLSQAHTAIDSLSVEKAVLISDVDSLYKIAGIYHLDIEDLKSYYNSAIHKISYYESKMPIEITSMDLKYKENEDIYSPGIPGRNKASKIFFDVKYMVNRYQIAATSIYPSVELYRPQWYALPERGKDPENEVLPTEDVPEAEGELTVTRPTELNWELRCYYKRTSNADYILKYTDTFRTSIAGSGSGSFATPSFTMGFNVFPEGTYRIELWNGRRCCYYTTFTID